MRITLGFTHRKEDSCGHKKARRMSGLLLYAFQQLFPEPAAAGMLDVSFRDGFPALAHKVPYHMAFLILRVQRIKRRCHTLQRGIANRPEEYIRQRVEPLAEAYHIGVHYAWIGNVHTDSGITHPSKMLLQLQAVEHEAELAVGVAPDLVEAAVAVTEIIVLDESCVAGQRHHIHNVGIRAEARNQSFDQPRGPYQIRTKRALVPFFIFIVSMCQHAGVVEQSINHNPLLLKLPGKRLDALLGAEIQLHHAD